jgi:hypothetical protein
MIVGVVVHQINTLVHPTIPPGFRWAVHVGTAWDDMTSCLNAGWAPNAAEAAITGEGAAVCAVKVARILGHDLTIASTMLDHDPIRAGNDLIQIGH